MLLNTFKTIENLQIILSLTIKNTKKLLNKQKLQKSLNEQINEVLILKKPSMWIEWYKGVGVIFLPK